MPLTSVFAEIETSVVLERANVATSEDGLNRAELSPLMRPERHLADDPPIRRVVRSSSSPPDGDHPRERLGDDGNGRVDELAGANDDDRASIRGRLLPVLCLRLAMVVGLPHGGQRRRCVRGPKGNPAGSPVSGMRILRLRWPRMMRAAVFRSRQRTVFGSALARFRTAQQP